MRLVRHLPFAILALCAGCVGTHVTMPGATENNYRSEMRMMLSPEATNPPPSILISWQHPATNVSFNVYSSAVPLLSGMLFRTNTVEREAAFPIAQDHEFFAVRAVYSGGRLSPWGTK